MDNNETNVLIKDTGNHRRCECLCWDQEGSFKE